MKKNGFCKFYRNLYWGQKVKNRSVVKFKLKHGIGQFNVFCVVRAMNDKDQLDIIHCALLRQRYFLEHPAYVYGIASSHEEAVGLVLRISQEASLADMDGNLLGFLDREKGD